MLASSLGVLERSQKLPLQIVSELQENNGWRPAGFQPTSGGKLPLSSFHSRRRNCSRFREVLQSKCGSNPLRVRAINISKLYSLELITSVSGITLLGISRLVSSSSGLHATSPQVVGQKRGQENAPCTSADRGSTTRTR